jgi:hypothetical protein
MGRIQGVDPARGDHPGSAADQERTAQKTVRTSMTFDQAKQIIEAVQSINHELFVLIFAIGGLTLAVTIRLAKK